MVFVGGLCLILASVLRFATLPLLLVSNALSEVGLTTAGSNQSSLRQGVTPDDMRGRVGASFAFATSGIQPVGLLLGGLLGHVMGIRGAIVVGVFGVLLTTIVILASPVRRVQTLSNSSDR